MRVVPVHGACVRDGAWWWHRAAAALEPDGVLGTAPPLPSCGGMVVAEAAAGPQIRHLLTIASWLLEVRSRR